MTESVEDARGLVELPSITQGDSLEAWSLSYHYEGEDGALSDALDIVSAQASLTDELGHASQNWQSPKTISLTGDGRIEFALVSSTADWLVGEHTGDVTITLASGATHTFVTLACTVRAGR